MFKHLSILLSFLSSRALADGYWDEQFGVPGAPGGVVAVARFGNKVIVGGSFTSIGGVSATNLAQWDGTNWAPVGGGVGGVVYALAVAGGQLYVGGYFTQVGDVGANNIARWDGTNWSALQEGVNDIVIAMASDGASVYAGGHFTMAGRNTVGKVARWDGTNWSGLGLGILTVGAVGSVDSLAVSGGNLYVGGDFRIAGGTAATNIARWDGSAWHALGNGLRLADYSGIENGAVRSLAIASDKLYAGGYFRLAGTTPATNIAAWDGVQWSELRGGTGSIGEVSTVTFSGSVLYAGGSFTNIGGIPAYRVENWDGHDWSALGSGVSELGRAGEGILGLASTGSELVAVGIFTSAGGQPSTNIALWHIPHEVAVQRSGTELRLSWPGTGRNFVLEACSSLSATNWRAVPLTPSLENGAWIVTNELTSTTGFYRLRRR